MAYDFTGPTTGLGCCCPVPARRRWRDRIASFFIISNTSQATRSPRFAKNRLFAGFAMSHA